MAVELKEGFSTSSYENLKSIAAQAFGHRSGERSNGGMGYMGLMEKMDGTFSVFKCLTHSDEYGAFEKAIYPEYGDDLKNASRSLDRLIRSLGTEAGVDSGELDRILSSFIEKNGHGKEGYLSRKMVASAVTLIAKSMLKSGDANEFWSEVEFPGTVDDTKLRCKQDDDLETVAFVSNKDKRNITLLSGCVKSSTDNIELPTTIDALKARFKDGNVNIGKKMIELLKTAIGQASGCLPSSYDCFECSWMFDDHTNEWDGHEMLMPLSDKHSQACSTWENVRRKLFRRSLSLALDKVQDIIRAQEKTAVDEQVIIQMFRRAIVRSSYVYAGMMAACDVAKERNINLLFEGCLFKRKYDEENVNGEMKKVEVADEELQDAIIEAAMDEAEKCFDDAGFVKTETVGSIAATGYLNGNFYDHKETDKHGVTTYTVNTPRDEENAQIKDRLRTSVRFIYSAIKCLGDEKLAFKDDVGREGAHFNDVCYMFDYSGGKGKSGDEIVNGMFYEKER